MEETGEFTIVNYWRDKENSPGLDFRHYILRKGVAMGNEKEGLSTAESLRKTRTYGQFRCHNPSCMGRLQPKPGVDHVKCPTCGLEFRVAWVKSGFPRIRGPVWDVNKRIAEETFERKMKEEKKDGPK